MRRRLLFTIATLVAAGLAAGAVPAFTADSGTIVITVTAGAPPAPCIQLSTTALDFGTVSFAANGSNSRGESSGLGVTNCSSAVSTFGIAGTDANGTAGSWALTQNWLTCDGTPNRYGLRWLELPERFSGEALRTTPTTLFHERPPANNPEQTFNPGESETVAFAIAMPCVGSNGAGQTFSFSIGLTATVG